jgi:hypothetical protein
MNPAPIGTRDFIFITFKQSCGLVEDDLFIDDL